MYSQRTPRKETPRKPYINTSKTYKNLQKVIESNKQNTNLTNNNNLESQSNLQSIPNVSENGLVDSSVISYGEVPIEMVGSEGGFSDSSRQSEHIGENLNENEENMKKIRKDIEYEELMIKALEENYAEMLQSTKELEKCHQFIDQESNEWKTRFENQIEINRQYAKQNRVVEQTLENLKNRLKNPRNLEQGNNDKINIAKEDKEKLTNELNDFKWRLQQEDKAYHVANNERKDILHRLNDARGSLNVVNMKVSTGNGGPKQPVYNLNYNSIPTFVTEVNEGASLASGSKNTFSSAGSGNANRQYLNDNLTNELELLEMYELPRNYKGKVALNSSGSKTSSSLIDSSSLSPSSPSKQNTLKLPKIQA